MITNISINKISPHPDNPRKNLGDLSELAASIKANGILQNLTVVPKKSGYCPSCNIYNSGIGKCKKDYDKDERPPCSKWESNGEFTVIIGHRRLAAAKLAGLTEVPCVISNMDYKKQLATMLLENMQRNDLTIWEQAQGFQMMLDFGETVSDISAQTGFSETTVRRRVKLLDLDKDKFQKSVERGATLQEYAELDKIRDVELKNSVLEKMGTPNFQWELRNAIDKETKATNKALLIVELKKFATQIEKAASDMCHVRWFSNFLNLDTKYLKPDDADNRKYFFVVSHYEIQLLVKKASKTDNEPEKAIQEERRQLQEQRERLDELHKRAYELRSEFVKNYAGRQKDARNIMEFSLKAMLLGDVDPYDLPNEICKVLGIEIPEPEDDDDSDGDEIMVKAVFEAFEVSPEKVLLVAAYCGLEDERARYCDWQGRFASHSALDALYALLEKIGYEMSEEERSLRDGTHELYVCTEAKNEN